MTPEKLIRHIEILEKQIEAEAARLKEIRFDAELLQSRLANASMKYGSYSEQELITNPRFPGLMGRLFSAMTD